MSFRAAFLCVFAAFVIGSSPIIHAQGVELSPLDESLSTNAYESDGRAVAVSARSADLRRFLPDPGDQKETRGKDGQPIKNSCIAWSIAHASYTCQIAQQRRHGPSDPIDIFSPAFLMEEISDASDGLTALEALQFVERNGCASTKTVSMGTIKASEEAMTFRAIKYSRVVDLAAIKNNLSKGYPVMMIVDLDESFENKAANREPYVWSGPAKGKYHAVTAVGFDDSKGALLLMNSWGSGWKNSGFCWVSYDNVNAITKGKWCVEAWVLKLMESAPFNAGYLASHRSENPFEDYSESSVVPITFTLGADKRVYDDEDKRISPENWEIVGLACNDHNELFLMKSDLTIYKRYGANEWIHLTAGEIKGKKVAMMAGSGEFPLHVLTADGKLFEYVGKKGPWKAVTLGATGTADLRLCKDDEQMRAVADSGDVYVLGEDDVNWALAP